MKPVLVEPRVVAAFRSCAADTGRAQIRSRTGAQRRWWMGTLIFCLATLASPVGAQLNSFNVSGGRDNTRLMGTVFDEQGNRLDDVQIQVVNDGAPAEIARGRTRDTGNYLIRDMSALYNRGDIMGIVARARFDRDGYETAVIRMRIRKNEIERAYIVLAPTEHEVELDGACGVIVGRVVNAKGKGVKKATVVLRSGGEVIAESGPTGKSGDFELVAWNTDGALELVVTAEGREVVEVVELAEQTQPDLLLPTEVEIRVE